MGVKPFKSGSAWVRYAGMGLDFAAAVGGFTLIGYLIDRHWQMYPKATLTGAILGMVGGMYNLIKASLAANREAREIDQQVARATSSDAAAENDRKGLRNDEQDGR